ncbi:hypothetical protein ARMGADRAFT_589361 [Armillaria gallica]|uniref:Uncharacterized protein n=1 Tax=Armillaria gallica TaxID=47427 RepID=A0A2H3E6M4_ARMGA|nr:hypothetical protein ARMGADRAFT_589361 [Armillaria gallica]
MAEVTDATPFLHTSKSKVSLNIVPPAILDFRAFCGRRKRRGLPPSTEFDMPDSQTKRREHDGSSHRENSPLRIRLWLNQFWPCCGTNEGDARCSSDGQVRDFFSSVA